MENYNIKDIKNIKCVSLSPRKTNHNSPQLDLDYIFKEYDKKMITLQNKLFSVIIKFHSIFKKLITDINSVLITLGNQAICSKSILLNFNYNDEKISHLNDRLEMINDTKNLLDNNLLIANNNLNMFISEIQKNFNEFKELKIKKEKDMNNFYFKNRIKRVNKALNYNSNHTEKRENNYLLLNSNPNIPNKNNKIENKIKNNINYNTTNNNKNDLLIDNYIGKPRDNYLKYIKQNNSHLNSNCNKKISNDKHQYCQSPNINNFSKKNISPKKLYYNKSQEIIIDNITSRQKQNNRNKRNYSSIMNKNRNNVVQYSNNIQRKHKVLNDKIINMTNVNKNMKNNYFIKWTRNLKRVNYRDKIFYKQREQEDT